ncbi:MAG: tetratricopeptide repeat protein, partial [Bacteroidia bacterium]|nr:tetratricopeptide repeat protein [Bacteroidia bacterium]
MSILRNIEKFNTHSMSDDTILSVVTGRDMLIQNLSAIIQENIKQPDTIQHVVLIGPRGMGKSFMLRYFQIITKMQNVIGGFVDFALLPEEQHNINTASEFIDELLARIGFNDSDSKSSLWDANHENWTSSVNKLRNEIEKRKIEYSNYLFIAAVENLDVLLESVFKSKVDESRFRKLLSGTPNFMLFATSLKSDIDTDYNKRLFYAFQKFHVEPWNEDDYLIYFRKRFELLKVQNPDVYDKKDIGLLTNKLKAISRFTGGSPRMAVVLTNLIFNDDAVSTAQTLNDIVEDLSPYYQDLMSKMPPRSKILFDTLIREKENTSQSELATKVGTQQATISQAFKWLLDNHYISGHKVNGEKQYRYSVSDRVFVLFYYKRYIHNGLQCSYIRILADFLVSFYDINELSKNTLKYLQSSNKPEGIEFAKLVFQKTGKLDKNINWENYNEVENEIKKIANKEELRNLFSKAENKLSEHDYKEALKLHQEALEKSIQENDFSQQLTCFEKIGRDFYELKEYEKAIDYHQKAYELRKQEGDISEQAWNLERIGTNFYKRKEYVKAIEYYQKAYELRKQEGDISEQAWNLEQIGWNYNELKEYERAIEYYQKAYELRKQEGDISE